MFIFEKVKFKIALKWKRNPNNLKVVTKIRGYYAFQKTYELETDRTLNSREYHFCFLFSNFIGPSLPGAGWSSLGALIN